MLIKRIKESLFIPWMFLIFYMFPDFFLSKYRYEKLNYIGSKSKKAFLCLKRLIEKRNVNRMKASTKIKVGIVIYTGSMWNVDGVYKKMKSMDKFDVDIIVGRFLQNDLTSIQKTFESTISYFEKKGYDAVKDLSEEEISTYDLLIYTTPYNFADANLNLFNIQLNTLICYVSYCYLLPKNEEKFNLPMYSLVWTYFSDTQYYANEISKKCILFSNNVLYGGYPKMDLMYIDDYKKTKCDKKTIIYAPHHSVTYSDLKSATFDINYKEILAVAKKYADRVNWIVKRHPMLADRCISKGMFKDYNEYESYWDEWRSMDGCEVVGEELYFDLFKNSDAMVTDSISFLVEYQFTHKPLLLLMSGKMEYNDFGKDVVKHLYKCSGNEMKSVENFIDDVLLEKDEMREERELFFRDNIDYYHKNGMYANDYMFYYLSRQLTK